MKKNADLADPRILDSQYQPVPELQRWLKNTSVDLERWLRQVTAHQEILKQPADRLKRARDVATRAAAVDTGAIEGLYETDRGFTFTVAMESAAWENAAAAKGAQFRVLFESQLRAYDYVLDFATGKKPLTEAFIRTLHEEICESQETYQVITEAGPQIQSLPKGQYKSHPNHVRTQDGSTHSYAPVDATPSEMHRLISTMQSEVFVQAHVVQQSAYAHYALAAIHPFADGNGRVARALASVFTYRDQSVPLVILVEHRPAYYAALATADKGNFQPFVDFIFSRAVESLQLVGDSVRTAMAPNPVDVAAALKSLYVNPSGYTHQQVDAAGKTLQEEFAKEISKQIAQLQSDELRGSASVGRYMQISHVSGYRGTIGEDKQVQISFFATPPVDVNVSINVAVSVPRAHTQDDDVILSPQGIDDRFMAPLSECYPGLSAGVLMRLRMYAERICGLLLKKLYVDSEKNLHGKGY